MSEDKRPSTRSKRVYEALLLAYPKEFRSEYGRQLTQVFGDLCREESMRRGTIGFVGLWARTLIDLLSSALAERSKVAVPLFSSPRVIRFGGLAAMVGGALSAVLALRIVWEPYRMTTYSLTPLFGEALDLLGMVGSLLIAVGTLGLYASVAKASPKLATLGVMLALLSAAAFAGAGLYESLVIASSGYPEDAITPSWAIQVAGTAKLAGYLLLSVAVFKARALGRWSALPLVLWLLPLATPLLFLPFTAGSGGEIVGPEMLINALFVLPASLGGVGWVLLGYLLWSGKSGEPEGPARDA